MAQEIAKPSTTAPVALRVNSTGDIRQVRDLAIRIAGGLGFPAAAGEEIGLVATELGANLLRHASHGLVTITQIEEGGRKGIQIETEDSGPGILDLEKAVADGYSTAGGLGLGLGTVNRLMDELEVYPAEGGGLHLVCLRWVRPALSGPFERRLVFGAATRPYRGLKENGDTFLIKQWAGYALVGVIDGLGHGVLAQRAANAARLYVEGHFDQPLEKLFRGAGRACRATRGVVMALARFDLTQKRLTLASVGNVEMRLVGAAEKLNLTVRRGIVGLNAPDAAVTENPWPGTGWLVLHSDGVSTHWTADEFRGTTPATPSVMAQRLLTAKGKPDDDATVVVAGNAA